MLLLTLIKLSPHISRPRVISDLSILLGGAGGAAVMDSQSREITQVFLLQLTPQ